MTDPIDIANKLADALDAWDGKLMMPEGWRTEAADTLRTQAAELTRLRADFAALQHALVGDTGASAILTAQRLRAALAPPAAPGWVVRDRSDLEPGAIDLTSPGIGRVVLLPAHRDAHSRMLYELASAMLSAAPQAPQPGAQQKEG